MDYSHYNKAVDVVEPEHDHSIKVCRSAAGYYIGRFCPECGPIERLSFDYYRTKEEAQKHLAFWLD